MAGLFTFLFRCTLLLLLLLIALPAWAGQGPELIESGKALFTGARKFNKGGAPCVSCHAFAYPGVHGGNLAPDLTRMYEGFGEQGMKDVLKSLEFPTMKRIYADKPLTDEEISALIAFARDAGEKKSPDTGKGPVAAGTALFFCGLIGLTLYKRRIG
jgi:cytochrome c553